MVTPDPIAGGWRSTPSDWIVSARFDLLAFSAPGIVAAALVGLTPSLRTSCRELPLAIVWLAGLFLCLDLGHVYTSFYRTYFDGAELRRRPLLHFGMPACCLLALVALQSMGSITFWRAICYFNTFHLARQLEGFVRLYEVRKRSPVPADRTLSMVTVWAAILAPLAYWHTHLPRPFAFFEPGDYAALPFPLVWPIAAALSLAVLAAYAGRQVWLWGRLGFVHWGRNAFILSTVCAWWCGVILCDSELGFLVTMTCSHAVPYYGITWLYMNRRWAGTGSVRQFLGSPFGIPIFLASLAAIGWGFEVAGDFLRQPHLPELLSRWMGFWVPLVSLPLPVHYIQDGYLWKLDGSNPGLRESLFGAPRPVGP